MNQRIHRRFPRIDFRVRRNFSDDQHIEAQSKLLREKNTELASALENIKTLRGLLPICSHCKRIRDDKGYWNQLETYIHDHSDAEFSHGICQECAEKYYSDYLSLKGKA